MNEQELRALVRDAIARHGTGRSMASPPTSTVPDHTAHASHKLLVLPTGLDTDGPCLIEPAVTCNHCGYCKSLGH
jgi:hypothetical protein